MAGPFKNVLGAFSVTALEPVGLEGVEADLTYASVGSDFLLPIDVLRRHRVYRIGRLGRADQTLAVPRSLSSFL